MVPFYVRGAQRAERGFRIALVQQTLTNSAAIASGGQERRIGQYLEKYPTRAVII